MTTTAQNTKISPNFPPRKPPRKCTGSADPWTNCIKICRGGSQKQNKKVKNIGKPGETSPFSAMNKYKMNIKNQKIQNVYQFFIFSSDTLQKVDGNQMELT